MIRILSKLGITDLASFMLIVKQFLKFGVVGLSNTLISLGIYYLLLFIGIHYLVANIIAFVTGVCNAYFWNSRFVFKNRTDHSKAKPLVKTFVAYGCTFMLSTVLLYIMVDLLGISRWVAPLINLSITTPTNFLLIKYWALR